MEEIEKANVKMVKRMLLDDKCCSFYVSIYVVGVVIFRLMRAKKRTKQKRDLTMWHLRFVGNILLHVHCTTVQTQTNIHPLLIAILSIE